ncbi:hypothetical protein ACQR3P_29415 [Rhodococcus sp. IEGM1300]
MGDWIGENRLRYGHAFDSELLNKESRALYEELKSAYTRIAGLEKEIKESSERHEDEVRAMSAHIEAIESAMHSLEESLDTTGSSVGRVTLYAGDMRTVFPDAGQEATEGGMKANLNHEESVVTCVPRRRLNKLVMVAQDGELILPEKVEVKVGRTNNGGDVRDTGERKVLESKTPWRREVIYDTVSAPVREDAIFEVSLPLLFSGDRRVNEVTVHPFPAGSTEVAGVQALVAGTWQDIAWNKKPQEPAMTKGPLRLEFKDVPAEAIRVRVVQETRKVRGSKTSFVLGLDKLEVAQNVRQEEEQYVLAKATMRGVYGVTRIEPLFQHPIAARQFRAELYRERDGILLPIEESTWHTLSEEILWVKVWLRPDASTGISPTLQAVRLHTRES